MKVVITLDDGSVKTYEDVTELKETSIAHDETPTPASDQATGAEVAPSQTETPEVAPEATGEAVA